MEAPPGNTIQEAKENWNKVMNPTAKAGGFRSTNVDDRGKCRCHHKIV